MQTQRRRAGRCQGCRAAGAFCTTAPTLRLADARLAGVFEAFLRRKERVRQLAGTMSGGGQNVKHTLAVAHRGYVLSQGRVIAAGEADQLRENPEVREAYFGRQ